MNTLLYLANLAVLTALMIFLTVAFWVLSEPRIIEVHREICADIGMYSGVCASANPWRPTTE